MHRRSIGVAVLIGTITVLVLSSPTSTQEARRPRAGVVIGSTAVRLPGMRCWSGSAGPLDPGNWLRSARSLTPMQSAG